MTRSAPFSPDLANILTQTRQTKAEILDSRREVWYEAATLNGPNFESLTLTLLVRSTWERFQAFLAKHYREHFPERQIYFRSHGVVRFVSLSPRFQFISMSVAFSATLWVGIASASLIFGNDIIEHKDKQIADLRNIRSDLHGQLVDMQNDLMERAATLQARQSVLDEMLERSDAMFGSIMETAPAITDQAEATVPDSDAPLPIGGPVTEPAEAAEEPETSGHDPLADDLSLLEHMQQDLLQRFDEQVVFSVGRLEKAIETAGLDIDKVLRTGSPLPPNQGGPLIDLDRTLENDAALQSLIVKVDRLETLEVAFQNIPLLEPVDQYYISSNYGGRRDPFTKRWAAHHGIDLGGRWKAPVRVTAPGTVTEVGWKGPYGRMVEVDHGKGFVTRYGHLRAFLVKQGQVLQTGDEIGLMGNSGRSTGTHLHYEIRFDGAPLNPKKFFEAAKYVQAI